MNKAKKASLIIGIGLPALMIILILAGIFIPRQFAAKPKIDFVYSIIDYSVVSGINYEIKTQAAEPSPSYYIYDVQTDTSQKISDWRFNKLKLNKSNKSTDGFIVGESYGAEPFGFNENTGGPTRYIEGHGNNHELTIVKPKDNYNYEFKFLGWVE